MSLSGRLEDLQVRDLLQILGLGHNSGLLQLRCGRAQAELLLDDGRVVSAWRQGGGRADHAAPLPCDTVDAALLNCARQRQNGVPFRSLDHWLIEDCGLAPAKLYASLRPAVFALASELLGWEEGDFSFQPGSVLETLEQIACGEHLCLDKGFDADDLLHAEPVVFPCRDPGESSSALASVKDGPGERAAGLGEEGVAVLLVDDDASIGAGLVAALSKHGLQGRCFIAGNQFLDAARAFWQAGHRPLMIVDLIMPRQHGGGILGGLELVEQVRYLQPDQTCLVYSDYPCPEIEQRLGELGVGELLTKPRPPVDKADAGRSVADAFCQQMARKAAALLGVAAPAGMASQPSNDAELASFKRAAVTVAPPSRAGLGLLKAMMQEMRGVESGDQVMLLVLRFATEMLNRAVLFSVGNERIVGLGQFGHGSGENPADEKVRRITVPLAEQSSLQKVVKLALATCEPLSEGRWDMHLRRELDLGQNDDVFIGPVLMDGRVVALLCGDNRSAGCGFEQRQMLEIFLQQAGSALENLQLSDNLSHLSSLLGQRYGC